MGTVQKQSRLQAIQFDKKEVKLKKPYSHGPYNKFNENEQWIRISEGCPNNCAPCAEPTELKWFGSPEIVRNDVKILDMNLLCHPEALGAIKELGEKRVNGHIVRYELTCGIDYRILTPDMAQALKAARFQNIRLAWDWAFSEQKRIKDTITILNKAGYPSKEIMVFMICNYRIPYDMNLRKLDLLKVWNVKAGDCYYDCQVAPDIVPIHWTDVQIKHFRKKIRKHNQIVRFGIDPEE
jgi:hypothetical protein